MSVNMSSDSFSIDSNKLSSNVDNTTQAKNSSVYEQDSVEVTSEESTLINLLSSTTAPVLTAPSSDSMVSAYRALLEALRAYKNQISASRESNVDFRSKLSQLAATQAEDVVNIIEEKAIAISNLNQEIASDLAELQTKIDEMQELAQTQQEEINQINIGNALEQQQYALLNFAYENYISQMNSIGAIDLGNGNFSIPKDAKDSYNQITQEYEEAVTKFNEYWEERSSQINQYNTATSTYNQSVAEYNTAVDEFINKYNLSEYLDDNNINLYQFTTASQYDLIEYQNQIDIPSTITTAPSTISIDPLPDYVSPTALRNLTYSSVNIQILYGKMYGNLYESEVAAYDQLIIQYSNYWSFAIESIESIDEELFSNGENLLNAKALARELLPTVIQTDSTSNSGSLSMQTLGLDHLHIQTIFGKFLLKEVILQSNLNNLEELQEADKQKESEQLADKILILSIGLLGEQSVQALFPSLAVIANSLNSLPKDSPAFAILFAVSLSNRIQESIQQGTTTEALQTFLNTIPEFSSLSGEDKAKLVASLNLGQLLISAKLLEDNLGLQGLLAQILPFLSPVLNSNQMIFEAKSENQQEHLQLQGLIKNNFVEQGYTEEEAQFLSEVGIELVQQGLLTPSLSGNISEETINQPLLEDSIKAKLLTSGYSLQETDTIAHEATEATLAAGPYSSMEQFRTALQSHLTDLGIKDSEEITNAAIVIPPAEKLLTLNVNNFSEISPKPVSASPVEIYFNPPSSSVNPPDFPPSSSVNQSDLHPSSSTNQPNPLSDSFPLPSNAPLPLTELATLVEERTFQLLAPQLGPASAKQISQEVLKTLFGQPSPNFDYSTETTSPYSLVNMVKDQIQDINFEQHQEWTNEIHNVFKESIKTLESFYAFSLKLMDPASLFIRASGIIYEDKRIKKAIDIPV